MVDWSKLPEELLGLIAIRLFSVIELLRFRSTCTSWRSSVTVADITPFLIRPLIYLNPLVISIFITNQGSKPGTCLSPGTFLSRASFYRVTLSSSSSSSQGWLAKFDSALEYGKLRFLSPLSRLRFSHRCKSIDFGKVKLTEIQQGYAVQTGDKTAEPCGFKRLVLVGNRVLGVGCDGKIRYWNGEIWTRIKNQVGEFCDVIVHGGLTYALDTNGSLWWVSSSLDIFRYGPSLDDENMTRDLSLVECCGELYIVERLYVRKRNAYLFMLQLPTDEVIQDDVGNTKWGPSGGNYCLKTSGFKVYKMDEESGKWVQVMSLGDKAFVMAIDACFSVLAHEFNGCLQNSIYFFTQGEYENEINVFKLDDGSITSMSRYGDSQSCFQMFVPGFVNLFSV